MKIIILRKILLIVPFLISTIGYSMREDPTEKTAISSTNVTLGTTPVSQTPTFVKVTFPTEQEKLKTAITQGSSHIHIYIPYNHVYQYKQERCDFHYNFLGQTNIKALIIEHSVGSERGYSNPALAVLTLLLKNATKLEEITLSQELADDLLPCLRVGVRVILDFSCSYRNCGTMYSKEYLIGLRNSVLAYYQEKYPNHLGFRIEALEIRDPFAAFYK